MHTVRVSVCTIDRLRKCANLGQNRARAHSWRFPCAQSIDCENARTSDKTEPVHRVRVSVCTIDRLRKRPKIERNSARAHSSRFHVHNRLSVCVDPCAHSSSKITRAVFASTRAHTHSSTKITRSVCVDPCSHSLEHENHTRTVETRTLCTGEVSSKLRAFSQSIDCAHGKRELCARALFCPRFAHFRNRSITEVAFVCATITRLRIAHNRSAHGVSQTLRV